MKYYLAICLTFFTPAILFAQHDYADSLKTLLLQTKDGSISRARALGELADYYGFRQFDSCLIYANQTIALSKKLNYSYGLFLGYFSKFHGMNCQGNYPKAFETVMNIQNLDDRLKKDSPIIQAMVYYFSGLLYNEFEDYPNAKAQFWQSIAFWEKTGQPLSDNFASYSRLGIIYSIEKKFDSARFYARKGYNLGLILYRFKKYSALPIGALGNVYVSLHKYDSARKLFHDAIGQSILYRNIYFQARNYNNLAKLYQLMNLEDSSIFYAKLSLQLSHEHNFAEWKLDASRILTSAYEKQNNGDSSLKYMKIMLAAQDSVFSQAKVRQFQQATFNEIQRLQQINSETERSQNRIRTYALSAIILIFLLLAFVLYRNSIQKQKAKINIEKAYDDLKSTQSQLIQSEKMASLGELTAGIAHEIQNPLNFVNNFSEVNKEMLNELQIELKAGNVNEAIVISSEISENEEKIIHHGNRADAIVKAMLQHSRTSSGQKELLDINAMADEYLRLSYQGLKARDRLFDARITTHFDTNIGKLNIIPQDISRVLVNLYNNAFYAVNERRQQSPNDYEPNISITTKKIKGMIEITVRDNGNGIPENIHEKIFQPFFTTKPAGQGTGLGLSLAYDIIKAHGGLIKVESAEGTGTEFVVELPCQM
jgi:signal transduction histidine kinase